MTGLFFTFLSLSVTVGLFILLAWAGFRAFGKPLSARCRYLVWVFLLLRLMIPVSLPFIPALIRVPVPEALLAGETVGTVQEQETPSASFIPAVPHQTQEITHSGSSDVPSDTDLPKTAETGIPAVDPAVTSPSVPVLPEPQTGDDVPADNVPASSLPSPVAAAAAVWLLVGAGIFAVRVISYFIYTHRLEKLPVPAEIDERYTTVCASLKMKRKPELALSPDVRSPMALGVFRPQVLLPADTADSPALSGVLAHELVHIRRLDLLIKWLSVLACSLHWFNPCVYLAAAQCETEMELSCDERVLSGTSDTVRRQYGNTLLDIAGTAPRRSSALTTRYSPKKSDIRRRIEGVLDSSVKNRGTLLLFLCLLLCALAGTVLACVPSVSEQPSDPADTEQTGFDPAETGEPFIKPGFENLEEYTVSVPVYAYGEDWLQTVGESSVTLVYSPALCTDDADFAARCQLSAFFCADSTVPAETLFNAYYWGAAGVYTIDRYTELYRGDGITVTRFDRGMNETFTEIYGKDAAEAEAEAAKFSRQYLITGAGIPSLVLRIDLSGLSEDVLAMADNLCFLTASIPTCTFTPAEGDALPQYYFDAFRRTAEPGVPAFEFPYPYVTHDLSADNGTYIGYSAEEAAAMLASAFSRVPDDVGRWMPDADSRNAEMRLIATLYENGSYTNLSISDDGTLLRLGCRQPDSSLYYTCRLSSPADPLLSFLSDLEERYQSDREETIAAMAAFSPAEGEELIAGFPVCFGAAQISSYRIPSGEPCVWLWKTDGKNPYKLDVKIPDDIPCDRAAVIGGGNGAGSGDYYLILETELDGVYDYHYLYGTYESIPALGWDDHAPGSYFFSEFLLSDLPYHIPNLAYPHAISDVKDWDALELGADSALLRAYTEALVSCDTKTMETLSGVPAGTYDCFASAEIPDYLILLDDSDQTLYIRFYHTGSDATPISSPYSSDIKWLTLTVRDGTVTAVPQRSHSYDRDTWQFRDLGDLLWSSSADPYLENFPAAALADESYRERMTDHLCRALGMKVCSAQQLAAAAEKTFGIPDFVPAESRKSGDGYAAASETAEVRHPFDVIGYETVLPEDPDAPYEKRYTVVFYADPSAFIPAQTWLFREHLERGSSAPFLISREAVPS